jgi:hypothetical protein
MPLIKLNRLEHLVDIFFPACTRRLRNLSGALPSLALGTSRCHHEWVQQL